MEKFKTKCTEVDFLCVILKYIPKPEELTQPMDSQMMGKKVQKETSMQI